MVVIPAGEFTMGSPPSEQGAEAQHRVIIATPFAVSKFEITFEEWDACLKQGGCGGYQPGDEGWGRGERPVINTSWEDAQAYVHWLSQKTGKPYRLLSESEWEYAARAGTTTPFSHGKSVSPSDANYDGSVDGSGPSDVNRQRTMNTRRGRRPTVQLGWKATAMAAWCGADRGKTIKLNFVRRPAPGATRRIDFIQMASASREVFDPRTWSLRECQ